MSSRPSRRTISQSLCDHALIRLRTELEGGTMKQMVEEYLRLPYTRRVRPDEGTRGESLYFAWVEELPGCESHGDTTTEAMEGLQDAMLMYIGSMLEDGLEPPAPASHQG